MIKAENQDNSRSVEHLIPNTTLTIKRKNNEGDFYACRKCNGRKSNIDYVLGVVAKSQSTDSKMAANTLIKAVTKDEKRAQRFLDMLHTVREIPAGVEMKVPIGADELIEYIYFLGKGQYFKSTNRLFNPSKQVIEFDYINKPVLDYVEKNYSVEHSSNPFRDLEKNELTEVVNNGECLIWSRRNQYLFIFHDYTAIIIKILSKNRKNMKKSKKSIDYIREHFDYKKHNQAVQ